MVSQKNKALDICRLLQISQHFRAFEKYSYGGYQQLMLILDTLEISPVLHQISSPQHLVCPDKMAEDRSPAITVILLPNY